MHAHAPQLDRWSYEQTLLQVQSIIDLMGMTAVLRRGVAPNVLDRPCRVFLRKYNAREMMGGLVDPMERFAIVGVKGLKILPDFNVDSLITFIQPMSDPPVEDENLRIIAPATPIKPAGILVAYKMRVRR